MELGRVTKNIIGSYEIYVWYIKPRELGEFSPLNRFTYATWVDFRHGSYDYRLVFVPRSQDGPYAAILGKKSAEKLAGAEKEIANAIGGIPLGEEPFDARKYKTWKNRYDSMIMRRIALPHRPDITRIAGYIEKDFNGAFSNVTVPLAYFTRVPPPAYEAFCKKFSENPQESRKVPATI